MKIVVVSPHRDDAAFSLSLAIGVWVRGGHRVVLLNCFTRSEYAPFADVESAHPNDWMSYATALRLREDEAWCRQVGIALASRIDLGLKDAPIRLHCTVDEVCSRKVKVGDKALQKISIHLERLMPDAVVLPLAIGGHVDHLSARESALPLSLNLPCAFYEDLPYAARPEAESIETFAGSVNATVKPWFAEPPQDPMMVETLKRRLVLCYDSQIDNAVVEQIVNFSHRYSGRERLWVNDAWLASALAVQSI